MSLASCGKEIICREKAIGLAMSLVEFLNDIGGSIAIDGSVDMDKIDYSIKMSSSVIPYLEKAIKTIASEA